MQKNFAQLHGDLDFREVVAGERSLAVREFIPATYLEWIKDRRTAQLQPDRTPLLTAESGMRVFGGRLSISRDEQGKDECPLEIHRGMTTYLKAPSGTGKTTLVKMLMGLIRGERMRVRLGKLRLDEHTPRSTWQRDVWGKAMTMAFQHADEALNLQATVFETFKAVAPAGSRSPGAVLDFLHRLFEADISEDFLDRAVRTLSGGQKQKLNLLRCLILETDILIFDEPLNGLDFSSAVKVIALLEDLQRAGRGILLISHNEEMFDGMVGTQAIRYLHAGKYA